MRVWDLASGKCTKTIKEHKHIISALSVSRDHLQFASGSHDRTVKIFSSELEFKGKVELSGEAMALAFGNIHTLYIGVYGDCVIAINTDELQILRKYMKIQAPVGLLIIDDEGLEYFQNLLI